MIMTEKFKILTEFIKDMSSETADVETYLFVKDQISKYPSIVLALFEVVTPIRKH